MPYVVIENFRYGLDTRRSNLTSVLGTLETLQDGYINQGGEIEKRKAFVAVDITPSVASGVTATFGIEALKDTIVIFGGQENLDEENWPPTGYTYQRLHRDLAANAASASCDVEGTPNYCAYCEGFTAAVEATAVVYSTTFGNKTFVIATMSDNSINAFYDGELVTDINAFNKMQPDMDSVLKMYCLWVRTILEGGEYDADLYDGGAGILVTGTRHRRFVPLRGSAGRPGVCNRVITPELVSNVGPDIPGVVSSGFFTIHDGIPRASVNQITSVKVGATELLQAAVDFTTSVFATGDLIVNSINANATPFNAVRRENRIHIYADEVGLAHNDKVIEVTVQNKVMIGSCELEFVGASFVLEYIKVDGEDILLGTDYTFDSTAETLNAFVDRVQLGINTGTATHGYVALNRANVLKFSKKTTRSNDSATASDDRPVTRGMIPVSVKITGTSGQVGDSDSKPLYVTIEPGELILYYYVTTHEQGMDTYWNWYWYYRGRMIDEKARAVITGGIPPYKISWERTADSNDTYSAIRFESPNSEETAIYDLMKLSAETPSPAEDIQRRTPVVRVTVVDSIGSTAFAEKPLTLLLR
jgi:hypothetical protein